MLLRQMQEKTNSLPTARPVRRVRAESARRSMFAARTSSPPVVVSGRKSIIAIKETLCAEERVGWRPSVSLKLPRLRSRPRDKEETLTSEKINRVVNIARAPSASRVASCRQHWTGQRTLSQRPTLAATKSADEETLKTDHVERAAVCASGLSSHPSRIPESKAISRT